MNTATMETSTRVLYIEDDNDSRRLVTRVLNNYGYQVYVAADGLDGVTLAREMNPHLVLIDIHLPNMDGCAVTTRLRSLPHLAGTPIIALTADVDPGSRELALAAGCTGFLAKPIDVDKFPRQIQSFLQGWEHTLGEQEHRHHLERHAQQMVEQLENKVRELQHLNQKLLELDRMKSDFIILASHELRTPLTLIAGYARLLEKELQQLDVSLLQAAIIVSQKLNLGVSRMSRVVDEIIDASRVASGSLSLDVEPVRLADVIDAVVAHFTEICTKRGLALHVADFSHLPTLQGDAAQIKTAVANLVENAIKYTPDGGHIYVECSLVDDAIDLCIRDTGIGIPDEEQRRIFDHFHVLGSMENHSSSKVAFQGRGLGLGLAIARGIIEAHHGRIWVESEGLDPESLPGSTFHILLPIEPFP